MIDNWIQYMKWQSPECVYVCVCIAAESVKCGWGLREGISVDLDFMWLVKNGMPDRIWTKECEWVLLAANCLQPAS